MVANLLLTLTEWNPQLFRELRGRLTGRNVFFAIAASLGLQGIALLYLGLSLPDVETQRDRYCTGERFVYEQARCVQNALGAVEINWQVWWGDLFHAMSWALPFILVLAGVYLLIGDLAKEERRGTLNFIRLSPQSSQQILLGKILGVPALPYLAILAAIPLHLWSAWGARVSFATVVSIYALTLAASCFCFAGALFYVFLGGFQGWVGALTVWLGYGICFQLWRLLQQDYYSASSLSWFHLPLGSHWLLALSFTLISLLLGSYWIWRAVNRRFRNPHVTVISKRQSYGMTLGFEVFIFGFVFRDVTEYYRPVEDLIGLSLINLVWFLVLMAALTPQRQALLDWARYRHVQHSEGKRSHKSLLQELAVGEKSPALGAIALNLLIPLILFTPWILSWPHGLFEDAAQPEQLRALAGLLLNTSFLLICAVVTQWALFIKSSKRTVVATGIVSALVVGPPTLCGMLSLYPASVPMAWLFSAFAFVGLAHASAMTIFLSLLGQIGFFSLLTSRFTHQLRRAGQSELKGLSAHPSH